MNLSRVSIDASRWGDTFWLIHDTLSSNGVPKDHPFLLQTVLRFHVDALTHVNVKRSKDGVYKETDETGPKNQWFLVIEGESLQACLSMQPCENRRTGAFGTLTLQIMDCYRTPPADLLFRQTYKCERDRLPTKAVLETVFFNSWHKFEIIPGASGFLHGRRHHMMVMLYDMQDTAWIGPRTVQHLDVPEFLEREYVWAAEELRLASRPFQIRPGRFRLDVGRPREPQTSTDLAVITDILVEANKRLQ